MDFGIANVAAITIICYIAGAIVKNCPVNNKWIPIVCGVFGIALGMIAFYIKMPDFPASDVLTAAAVGCASGFAATGVNQVGKQLSNNN